MRRAIWTAVFTLANGVVFAAAKAGVSSTAKTASEYDYSGGSGLTMIYGVKVVIILLIMWGMAYAAGKIMKKYNITSFGGKLSPDLKIKTISTLIADKKIAIVEINEKEYILGITKDTISLIDKNDMKKNTKGGKK